MPFPKEIKPTVSESIKISQEKKIESTQVGPSANLHAIGDLKLIGF